MLGIGAGALDLRGRRVLIAEDEAALALDLKFTVIGAGGTVLGPESRVAAVIRRASHEAIDAALLDICLRGELVFDAADVLANRSIPFAFMTGYDDRILPQHFRNRPICFKPCASQQLIAMLRGMVAC